MKGTKTLEFEVFRDKDGNPACSLSKKENCYFLGNSTFGTKMICTMLHDFPIIGRFYRTADGVIVPTGLIRPHENCPLHKQPKNDRERSSN